MLKRGKEQQSIIKRQVNRLKGHWQSFFLPAAGIYSLSLLHLLYQKPAPNAWLDPYYRNIDLLGFIIAVGLALAIFNLKRTYFSSRYFRRIAEETLVRYPDSDDEGLVQAIFTALRPRLTRIWLLGLLLVLDGVVFYWLTFNPQKTMHTYFIAGVFALLVNYPRKEMFSGLEWQLAEARRDSDKGDPADN